MDLPVYMHNGCSVFTRSARLMLHHLRISHNPAVAPFFNDGPSGLAILDGQISEHLLATSPPGTLSHVCLTCNVLLGTRFAATTHLTLPPHLREYNLALSNTGEAGIRALLTRRYVRTTEAAQSTEVLAPESAHDDNRVLTGSPGQLRYLQSFYTAGEGPAEPKTLRLSVSDYTTRRRFPGTLELRVVVPRTTTTVARLARCVEEAFVKDAQGEENAIDWARVIAVCGIVFEGDGGAVVREDEEVAAWVAMEGEGEERADMRRREWS